MKPHLAPTLPDPGNAVATPAPPRGADEVSAPAWWWVDTPRVADAAVVALVLGVRWGVEASHGAGRGGNARQ